MNKLDQKIRNNLLQISIDLQGIEKERLEYPMWIDKHIKQDLDESEFLLKFEQKILLNLLKGEEHEHTTKQNNA